MKKFSLISLICAALLLAVAVGFGDEEDVDFKDDCCWDDDWPNEKGFGSVFGAAPNEKDGGAVVPEFS